MAAPLTTPALAAQLLRRRRPRALVLSLSLSLAAALALAAALPSVASAQVTSAGHFVLERKTGSTELSNILEVVYKRGDGTPTSTSADFQTITNASDWVLNAWDNRAGGIEEYVRTNEPTLTHLELAVRLDESLGVKNLAFERTSTSSFDPTLVFSGASLGGLGALDTLKFVKFNVTFNETSWLPTSTRLSLLSFDQCTIPSFTIDLSVTITRADFRGSNLTEFPNFLLNLKTPLKSLILENNRFMNPVWLRSEEYDVLKNIPTVVSTNNTFASSSVPSSMESPATSITASSQSCHIEMVQNIPICIRDIGFRSNKPSIPNGEPKKTESEKTTSPLSGADGSSGKLTTAVITILSVCGVAILVVASVIYRRRKRLAAFSGDTRSSFYEHSDILLSPSKLEPAKEEAPALPSSQLTPGTVADLDLGRDVVHLGKKLGVHGLRKGEYRDEPVVALRVSLRSLHISMREVNRIITSYAPLRHRNIVELIGTSMTALEDLLIVVEYMGKGSLRSVLRNPKVELQWQDRLRMTVDICCALDFIHSARPSAVAKNLTSKSVLCSNELVCKLDIFDYGRKVRDHVAPVLSFGQCEIASRSPEVLAGEPVTRAAEVYALGVIMCEISLRQMPFEDIINDKGPTIGDLYIAREVAAQRLQLKPAEDAPSEYQQLALRCLSFDPASRPTVPEILQALQA